MMKVIPINSPLISIAPMMAYTDRHYRYFIRLLTAHTLLYTEMVHSQAVIFGNRERLLAYSKEEHPLALQLGGSDAEQLQLCAKIATEYQYDEINLNVGCPSERVQSGQFGACLFKSPQCVAEAVAAMQEVTHIPVTVKTRIGVDDFDSYQHLYDFIEQVSKAGCKTFILHARKAWLKGLNPKQNRDIPPLQYPTVYQVKDDFPHLNIIINGGIKTLADMQIHLHQVDGVMIGREAYDNPFMLATIDQMFYQSEVKQIITRSVVVFEYLHYAADQLLKGVPLRSLIKPIMNLFQGQFGARNWRRYLCENASHKDINIFEKALAFTQQ